MTEAGERWAMELMQNYNGHESITEMRLMMCPSLHEVDFFLRALFAEVEKRAENVDVKRRNARIAIAFDQIKRELLGE